MKTDLVRKHFDQRAADFEQYSDWCSNEQLFDLCVEPVEDMVPDARCLDLGGGSGWIARRDSERSRRRWVVLDLSLNMAQHVRGASVFVGGDAHALPFRDCSFAHVVIRSVLHYVNAPVVLLEAKRILTRRGHVVVAQKIGPPPDNFEWHQNLLRLRRGEMTQWTDESIDAVLRASGLTPISSRVFRERRRSNFESWLSRDGTIATDSREDIRKLVIDAPDSVRLELGLEVSNGIISYDRRWQVVVARVKPPRGEITPGVVTMIVERIVPSPGDLGCRLHLRPRGLESCHRSCWVGGLWFSEREPCATQ
jgi:ubiquinone/menaquinone biosynthesis C-methylase UbiE